MSKFMICPRDGAPTQVIDFWDRVVNSQGSRMARKVHRCLKCGLDLPVREWELVAEEAVQQPVAAQKAPEAHTEQLSLF